MCFCLFVYAHISGSAHRLTSFPQRSCVVVRNVFQNYVNCVCVCICVSIAPCEKIVGLFCEGFSIIVIHTFPTPFWRSSPNPFVALCHIESHQFIIITRPWDLWNVETKNRITHILEIGISEKQYFLKCRLQGLSGQAANLIVFEICRWIVLFIQLPIQFQ